MTLDLNAPLLLHGDCMELMATLPAHSVDFVCCDPPYGITSAKWDQGLDLSSLWTQLRRILKPNGITALFAGNMFTFDIIQSNLKAYKYRMIWVKSRPSGHLDAKFRPLRQYEEICLFSDAGLKSTYYDPQKSFGHEPYSKRNYSCSELWSSSQIVHTDASDGSRYPTNVLQVKSVSSAERRHPTQKPVDLLSHLIKSYCPPGGMVLDFCMGSGSTGVAAVQCGRQFTGIEISDEFFPKARDAVNEAYSSTWPELPVEEPRHE